MLLSRLQSWAPVRRLAYWRRKLLTNLFIWDKENLFFVALFGLVIAVLGGMVWLAYVDHLRIRWAQQRQADLICLARNIYHEARGEPIDGQYAVAEVTLNRVASRLFPDTVCEVVYEKRLDISRNRLVGAFSWTELDSVERPAGAEWRRAMKAAETIYDRQHEPTIPGALFYHADRVEPYWAKTRKRVTQIGNHVFYE